MSATATNGTTNEAMMRLLSLLHNVRKTGKGWSARCPAHEDDNNSLSIDIGNNKGVVLCCHAGCKQADVVAAVGLDLSDLFAPDSNGNGHSNGQAARKLLESYPYCDENGVVLYNVCRYEPKGFAQRRPKEGGGWIWSLGNVRRVLYRLPELCAAIEADPNRSPLVFVVEGEKDVGRLRSLGLTAVCNPGGGTEAKNGESKWLPTYSDSLRGCRVIVIPDADGAGRAHAAAVARMTHGKAASVKIVELGLTAKGADVSDWLAAGGTCEQLMALAEAATEWEPETRSNIGSDNSSDSDGEPPLLIAKVECMADITPKPVEWFWQNYIPAGAITILDGDPNEGKSTIATDLAARLSRGDCMPPSSGPDGTFDPRNTLLISAEDDPERTTLPRLTATGANVQNVHLLRELEFTATGEKRFLQLPVDIPIIEKIIVEMKIWLLVLDVLSAMVQDGLNTNCDSDMRRLMTPLSQMAERTQCTILALRHMNKKEGLRSMYRGGGSVAIIGAARAGYAVAPNPNDPDEKVLVPIKHNLGPKPPSLTYRIEAAGTTSKIVWGGITDLQAADVLKSDQRSGGAKVEKAKEIIADLLANGPCREEQVKAACDEAKISESTYWRARKQLKVHSEKSSFSGHWNLSLPSKNGAAVDDF